MWSLLLNLFVWPLMLLAHALVFRYGVTLGSLGTVLLFPVLTLASVALHEAGHALAARALGFSVPRIDLGVGRRVARWTWAGTRVTLHAFPTLGFTFFGSDSERNLRSRMWLGVAAGPLVTAALVVAAARWPSPLDWFDVLWPVRPLSRGWAPRELLAFANLWLLVFNLLPFQFLFRSMGLRNDGTLLVSLLSEPSERLRAVLEMPALLEAQECSENHDHSGALRILEAALQKNPSSFLLRNSLAVTQLSLGRLGDARASFLQLIAETEPSRPESWLLRNNLAWTNYLLRAEDLRSEADEHSAAVLERFKQAPWANGTRGAVLIWKGDVAKALPLLERAFLTNSLPQARAHNACGLAIAHARCGNPRESERWLRRAEENDPTCALLGEARDALAKAA